MEVKWEYRFNEMKVWLAIQKKQKGYFSLLRSLSKEWLMHYCPLENHFLLLLSFVFYTHESSIDPNRTLKRIIFQRITRFQLGFQLQFPRQQKGGSGPGDSTIH